MTFVSASARRPSARRTSRLPLVAGGAQVGEAVHDDDVLGAEAARELERLLQPLADAEVGEDPPGLVDDDDPLGVRSSVSASIIACSQAVAQVIRIPSAVRVGVEDGAEVEHDERRVEVEAGRRRAVEHAAQVAAAELVERERHRPRPRSRSPSTSIASASPISPVGWSRTSTTSGSVGSSSARSLEDVERLLAGALLLRRRAAARAPAAATRVEQVELPLRRRRAG